MLVPFDVKDFIFMVASCCVVLCCGDQAVYPSRTHQFRGKSVSIYLKQ